MHVGAENHSRGCGGSVRVAGQQVQWYGPMVWHGNS